MTEAGRGVAWNSWDLWCNRAGQEILLTLTYERTLAVSDNYLVYAEFWNNRHTD
jgi:hypothetical protein